MTLTGACVVGLLPKATLYGSPGLCTSHAESTDLTRARRQYRAQQQSVGHVHIDDQIPSDELRVCWRYQNFAGLQSRSAQPAAAESDYLPVSRLMGQLSGERPAPYSCYILSLVSLV